MVKLALVLIATAASFLFPGGLIDDGPVILPVPIELPDCTDVYCTQCPAGTTPIYSTHECCPICGPEIE